MTTRIRRGRRHIRCTVCGKDTSTRHSTTTLCAECRAQSRPHTPINIGSMPKAEIDAWIASGGAA